MVASEGVRCVLGSSLECLTSIIQFHTAAEELHAESYLVECQRVRLRSGRRRHGAPGRVGQRTRRCNQLESRRRALNAAAENTKRDTLALLVNTHIARRNTDTLLDERIVHMSRSRCRVTNMLSRRTPQSSSASLPLFARRSANAFLAFSFAASSWPPLASATSSA